MAKAKVVVEEEKIKEDISIEPLEEVMGEKYAIYAKYVIQDRAIPDVRDGLKPVQRRIIYSMWQDGNLYNKPTKKCAHTVGAVMGTYHPHGDSSIYEALARLSQDWKVRYPLVDFQGNNGSIDGDAPAAYRYTESRLSKLSNELIRDIDKNTVDMQLNYDDTRLEPVVLPSRFPNLFVNGAEGIAVALATEIPPHNLKEMIEASIYRIKHPSCTVDNILDIIQGPDFPTGGIIYKSEGLRSIYTTGKGRIEIAARCEIVEQKDMQQIIITEVPYKVVKINIAYEIDKIRHDKAIDGILEVRDESDIEGIKIVVDIKKDAKADLILTYLMNKTSLRTSYTANIVAIVNGRPKTLNILEYLDSYNAHQVDVVTRKTKFDLEKYTQRLHIVDGLIIASLNINEVVEIIRKSKDKADSKVNLMEAYKLSNDQAEAIVTMPLYKLSHTDELALENEKKELETNIERCNVLLNDPEELNKQICKDLKEIEKEYGDERRTSIEEKGEVKAIDKRELIAKEECMISLSRDGYAKRSSPKSYRSSGDNPLPGLKAGDILVGYGKAYTTDYLIAFTNLGNYICIPVHELTENKWKEEGNHLNNLFSLTSNQEKFIKGIVVSAKRDDLYLALLTRSGQIKRMNVNQLEFAKRSRPSKCMKISPYDQVVDVAILSGNSNLFVLSESGKCTFFNENDITIVSSHAGGVKSMNGLAKDNAVGLLSFDENEHAKILYITNRGCARVDDITHFNKTQRLGKTQTLFTCFKNDIHKLVVAYKVTGKEPVPLYLSLNDGTIVPYTQDDFYLNDVGKMMKKNITAFSAKYKIDAVFGVEFPTIDKNTISHPIIEKVKPETSSSEEGRNKENEEEEQLSIFETSEEDFIPYDDFPDIPLESQVVEDTIEVTKTSEGEIKEEKVIVKEEKEESKEEKPTQLSIFDNFDDDE